MGKIKQVKNITVLKKKAKRKIEEEKNTLNDFNKQKDKYIEQMSDNILYQYHSPSKIKNTFQKGIVGRRKPPNK